MLLLLQTQYLSVQMMMTMPTSLPSSTPLPLSPRLPSQLWPTLLFLNPPATTASLFRMFLPLSPLSLRPTAPPRLTPPLLSPPRYLSKLSRYSPLLYVFYYYHHHYYYFYYATTATTITTATSTTTTTATSTTTTTILLLLLSLLLLVSLLLLLLYIAYLYCILFS